MSNLEQKITNLKMQRMFNLTIILFLIVISVISLEFVRNKAKDTKRLADIKQIQTALDIYQSRFEFFPTVSDNDYGGWDTTFETGDQKMEFINVLMEEKIIDRISRDPVNSRIYNYRYQKFPANSFGCEKPFYILQIMNFENWRENHGWGACPERNFVEEALNGYTIQVFE